MRKEKAKGVNLVVIYVLQSCQRGTLKWVAYLEERESVLVYHAKATNKRAEQSSTVTKRLLGLMWTALFTAKKNPPAGWALVAGIIILLVIVSSPLLRVNICKSNSSNEASHMDDTVKPWAFVETMVLVLTTGVATVVDGTESVSLAPMLEDD